MKWKGKHPNEWRRWFAWYPIKLDYVTDCEYVWLEFVNRKYDAGMRWFSQKPIEDLREYYG